MKSRHTLNLVKALRCLLWELRSGIKLESYRVSTIKIWSLQLISAALIFHSAKARADCYDDVVNKALKLCTEIQKSGEEVRLEGKAAVDLESTKIVKSILGGGSVKGGGDASLSRYEGLVREQLGAIDFKIIDCRENMSKLFIRQCERPPVQPKINELRRVTQRQPSPPPPPPPVVTSGSVTLGPHQLISLTDRRILFGVIEFKTVPMNGDAVLVTIGGQRRDMYLGQSSPVPIYGGVCQVSLADLNAPNNRATFNTDCPTPQ